jgi:uncharacterized protein
MRTITLEEHFATAGFLDGPGRDLKARAHQYGDRAAKLLEQLCDLCGKRIAEMDAAGIDVQVLSLTSPGTEQLEAADSMSMASDTNNLLAEAVKKIPPGLPGSRRCPLHCPIRLLKNSSGWCVSTTSREQLSTVTIGAAIWTISFSGRS